MGDMLSLIERKQKQKIDKEKAEKLAGRKLKKGQRL